MTGARYPLAARLLHWLVAAAVPTVLVLGPWMVWFAPSDGAARHSLFNLHESLGVAILLLMLLRVALRVLRPPPPLPARLPGPIRTLARLNHAALYAVLLAMPVVGYLLNSAQGAGLRWFEAVSLPPVLARDPASAHALGALHLAGAVILGGLLALHVAAAVHHGLIRRDGVIWRML